MFGLRPRRNGKDSSSGSVGIVQFAASMFGLFFNMPTTVKNKCCTPEASTELVKPANSKFKRDSSWKILTAKGTTWAKQNKQ